MTIDLAPLAKFRGDLIGARRIAGHDGEADHVAGIVKVDIFNRFIDQIDFPRLRRVGGDRRQSSAWETNRAPFRRGEVIGIVARIGIDQ